MIIKFDEPEEYYRKLLLLNKIKPCLSHLDKQYIFNKGFCWDVFFKDKFISHLCYGYAIAYDKRIPEGESYILESAELSYMYARNIIKGRWAEAEALLMGSSLAKQYLNFIKFSKYL